MRWLFAVPLGLLGLVLLTVGASAAVVVGPDDTFHNKTETLGDGTPVVTDPDVLSWERLHLQVRAESDGEVFVGAGHPVDVTDYTADAARFSVDTIQPLGVSGRDWRGDDLPARPGDLDLWTDHETGSGTQTLSLEIDGDPVQVLIAPVGEDPGPVDVAFGATIDGLFLWSVITAGVGVLLLLLALGILWWSRRRARKREARAAPYPSVPPPPIAPPPATPPVTRGHHAVRRLRLAVPAAALLLLGTGCSAIPEPVAYDEPSKLPLTDDDGSALKETIDARWAKAARAASHPRYRHQKWSAVATGPFLKRLVFSTRSSAVDAKSAKEIEWERTYSFAGAYAVPQDSYPMWAINGFQSSWGWSESRLTLLVRRSAASPWKLHTDVPTTTFPGAAESPAPPSDEEVRAGVEIVNDLRRYWTSGRKPTSVELPDDAKTVRDQVRGQQRHDERKDWVTRARWRSKWDENISAVPVQPGTLYVADVALIQTIRAPGGISWEPPYDKLHETVSDTELRRAATVSVAVLRDDNGSAELLGAEWSYVASGGRGGGSGSGSRPAAHPTP